MNVGLAEYTNANFFSSDTIFAENNIFSDNFPYPRKESTDLTELESVNKLPEQVLAIDSVVDNLLYVSKTGDGELVDHFVKPVYFTKQLLNANVEVYERSFFIDDRCTADYAKLLIPRAVSYSSALLDYFFRGKLEVTPPSRFVLGMIDDADFFDPVTGERRLDINGNPVVQEFEQIKVKVRNDSVIGYDAGNNPIYDDIGAGTLVAVARYLERDDYLPDLSNDPPIDASVKDVTGDFYPYSYSVSAPVNITPLDSTTATEKTFDFSQDPIPAGITDLDIFVVFKGTLGQELDDAIAVGRIAEMNEPFHYAVENSTEYVIGSDGSVYQYPDTGWSKDFQVCFNPYPGTCTYPPPTTLNAGEYSEIII